MDRSESKTTATFGDFVSFAEGKITEYGYVIGRAPGSPQVVVVAAEKSLGQPVSVARIKIIGRHQYLIARPLRTRYQDYGRPYKMQLPAEQHADD